MKHWITLFFLAIISPALCQLNAGLDSIFSTTPPISYGTSSVTQQPPVSGTEGLGCGWRQEAGLSNRISGVTDAFFGEFPWVVAIFKYSDLTNSYEYCCVGSLIHPNVVLSVKHHFKQAARIRIRAGDWDISGEYEIRFHQSSDVNRVLSHPRYKASTNEFDAALLILSTPITLAPNVAFACLPAADLVTAPGTTCIVAGWGQETATKNETRQILKMIELPVVDFDVCETRLKKRIKKIIKMRPFNLSPSMMCAGGEEGVDACLKDGGAPLVCSYSEDSTRYYQAGIVSWGFGCGEKDVPGVYTSVPKVREWIDKTMTDLGYSSDSYSP